MSKPTERAGAPLVIGIIILSVVVACLTVYLAMRTNDQSTKKTGRGGFQGRAQHGINPGAQRINPRARGEITNWWRRTPAIACFLPEKVIAALKEDPRIAYVTLDREIRAGQTAP